MIHTGLCKKCRSPIIWMLTRHGKFIPVEDSSLSSESGLRRKRSDDGREFYVFDQSRGHRSHFEYCRATATDRPPPPTTDETFTRRYTESAAFTELHLTEDAPVEVVKAAYRALSLLYHPDRGADQEKMKRINVAYEKIMKRK